MCWKNRSFASVIKVIAAIWPNVTAVALANHLFSTKEINKFLLT
jgi:hypothetical protein